MDYVSGAMAGAMACCFTNPLDVIKTRLQLQGELKARNQHSVPYKNTFHSVYTIAKNDGLVGLQKGLVPALWFQVFFNGVRLGGFDALRKAGWTSNKNNEVSFLKTIAASVASGCAGSVIGSPFYLIKTHLQSQSSEKIAVGYQHHHTGMISAMRNIYKKEGIRGLWRGAIGSLPRVAVGSAAQLGTFSKSKEFLEKHQIIKSDESLWNTFAASMLTGVVVALFMSPFDVVQTRLYNQGVDKNGKGLLYSGIVDCLIKMKKTEGFLGFFKGLFPCYLRIGPHSLLCLMFWDAIKKQPWY